MRRAMRAASVRRARLAVSTAGALGAAALLPEAASAHGLVGRTDLPVPSWLFGWAAAIVLVASFAALATLWPEPRLQRVAERRLFRIPTVAAVVCGLIGIGLFVVVVYAGIAGTKEAAANLAPNLIYVHFWVGLVVASVLFGDIFRAFNPWRAAARAVAWAARRAGSGDLLGRRPYTSWLGRWPAVLGIAGFAWLELAYTNKDDPAILAFLCLGYAAVQLVGMGLYGIDTWTERGDAFSVYFNLFSRLSVFDNRDGVVHLRPPLAGAPPWPLVAGSVALLCTAIGSTTFDGFSNGPVWASISPHIQSFFSDIGAGPQAQVQWASTVGLAGCIAAISLFFHLGIRGMQSIGEGHSASELAGRFVHTLIPIAFAYALAHYFSLLVYQGQAAAYLISDPLGDGSNIFGTARSTIDYGVISSTGIWYVQVGALITGHLAGLILAHDRAVSMYRRVDEAARSQYWMLVVMVGFTSLGLWLLSSVNT
jgi:hypothetical protein